MNSIRTPWAVPRLRHSHRWRVRKFCSKIFFNPIETLQRKNTNLHALYTRGGVDCDKGNEKIFFQVTPIGKCWSSRTRIFKCILHWEHFIIQDWSKTFLFQKGIRIQERVKTSHLRDTFIVTASTIFFLIKNLKVNKYRYLGQIPSFAKNMWKIADTKYPYLESFLGS